MSAVDSTSASSARSGLLAGGNFIVDNIVRIDRFPAQDTLVNIEDEQPSNGGGPFNVLRDLAALKSPFALSAVGLVGQDPHGDWIQHTCEEDGIEVTQLHRDADHATSHTHVMTVSDTGRRTFFHHRGANTHLKPEHFDFSHTSAKLFYLGYLMLLDGLDARDESGRTGASYVLEQAQQAGLTTIVDLVSVTHPDFHDIVASSLPWIDHLILNEVEASQFLKEYISASDPDALATAATRILDQGVGQSVVIHTSDGAVNVSRHHTVESMGALTLPPDLCRGTNGAGDAFAAGFLYGLHENWTPANRLRLATNIAACSLTEASPSAGIRPLAQSLELMGKYPSRPWRSPQPAPLPTR